MARSSPLARRASSGVATCSFIFRSSSCSSPTWASSTSTGSRELMRILGRPKDSYSGPRWYRSSSISRAARRLGGSAPSSWSMLTFSAAAKCWSSVSLGSRLPFSTRLSWLGAVPTAALRSSSVSPACLRRWRTRRPSAMTSSSAAAADGGWETSLFQLEGDISEEYVKKCISFHSSYLERGLKVLKSSSHGKKHRTGKPVGTSTTRFPPTPSGAQSRRSTMTAAFEPTSQTPEQQAAALELEWAANPRWEGVTRDYSASDVVRLRGRVSEEHTLARRGSEKLWKQLTEEHKTGGYTNALGALTGNQAVQQVKAGLRAIYLSGWQVAADANNSGHTYPDQSLYPANSVPTVVRRINNALLRADQIEFSEGIQTVEDWMVPIVADAEAGFGGPLNAYELMKSMIQAGASGVHWEDQLASEKKCGHLGGKVLIPTQQHVRTLNAARLAADVAGTPSVIIARTDAEAATLITSDVDERDQEFILREGGQPVRTPEGFYKVRNGIEPCIARAKAYAPYSDLIWMETGTPDLELARKFAESVKAEFPDQMLSYNCSPSFNWRKHLDDATIAKFQRELGAMGFTFQFITLAGFHALNYSMFDLAHGYAREGMSAYVELQEKEFASEARGYTATKHQREVGTGYFDDIATALNPNASTLALVGSTEEGQFH